LKNAYLYAENDHKMTNFWFKEMSKLEFLLKNGKNWTILVKNFSKRKNSAVGEKF
jgi:hypothetical protein